MLKIKIVICSIIVISQAIPNNQQLSKKMGSHVNGERYKGSYKNGLKHGHGTWTHPDGDKYQGKFKSGLKRGNGVYTFKNGEEYRGHYKRDKQHGLGQYKYNNGEVFKGEFKNNIRDGQGFIVFRGDTIKSGIWKNDQFIKKIRLKNVSRHLKATYPKYKKTKNPPLLALESRLELFEGKDILETSESANLILRLTNRGKGKAQGIEIFIELKNYSGGLVLDGIDIIQKLLPGESKQIEIPIFASEMMISEKVLVSTYITEYFGHDVTSPNVLTLVTKSLTSPELILTDIKINDQNNKNGLIEPAEIIEATMYVRCK